MDMKQALEQAVRDIGGVTATARLFEIKPPSVSGWLAVGRAPADRVLKLESNSSVSRFRLRPDVYGAEESAA